MKIYSYFVLFLFLPVFFSCRNRYEGQKPNLVIATVNGEVIKSEDLLFRLQLEKFKYDEDTFSEPGRFESIKKEILDEMINQKVVATWGKKNGFTLTSEELAKGLAALKSGYSDKEFEFMLSEKNVSYAKWRMVSEERILTQKILQATLYDKITVTHDEIQKIYEKNKAGYKTEEQVRVRQIVTDSLEKALALHKRALAGENFAKLAVMNSISPDRERGGDLGFFAKGSYPKEFDDTCFKLKKGEISDIVKSPYGHHIFKLLDTKPAGFKTLAEVSDEIKGDLLKQRRQKAYNEWFEKTKKESDIEIDDEALEEVEL